MTARLRRRLSGDAGFTLAELLVTIFLSMLIMALVTGLVQTSRGVLVTERARTNDLAVVFPAIDQVQRSIRAATPPAAGTQAIESASSSSITYYSLLYTEPQPTVTGNDAEAKAALATARPKQITLTYDDATDRLLMETLEPKWDSSSDGWHYPSGLGETRVLATGLANTAAQPVFRYLNTSGTPVAGSLLDAGSRQNVAFVEVHLVIDTNNGTGAPVEVTDTIRLANYGTES